jgi:GIY-YIG catalytic domain
MRGGWIYFITNKPNGILYTGVTSDLPRRIFEHREGIIPGFTKRYGLKERVFASGTTTSVSRSRAKNLSSVGRGHGKFGLLTAQIRTGTTFTMNSYEGRRGCPAQGRA